MLRTDSKFKPEHRTLNCVLADGGIGDHIGGSFIAVDYIIKTYPWIKILLWVPDMLQEFAKNVLPSVTVRTYSDMAKGKYDEKRWTIHTKWDQRHSTMKCHIADYAFHVLCDEHVDTALKNSLKVDFKSINTTKFKLPEKYVVFTVGYTAPVREFHPQTVNALTNFVKSKGYTPVFLGSQSTPTGSTHIIEAAFDDQIRYDDGVTLINQTSLLEAAKIIQNSACIVGVDCGLLHVAGCTDAKIVGGYTTVNPELRMPIRNNVLGWKCYPVTPDEDLKCRYCQVKTNFIVNHDYKQCIYRKEPDKDRVCVKQLTADKFISHLDKILT